MGVKVCLGEEVKDVNDAGMFADILIEYWLKDTIYGRDAGEVYFIKGDDCDNKQGLHQDILNKSCHFYQNDFPLLTFRIRDDREEVKAELIIMAMKKLSRSLISFKMRHSDNKLPETLDMNLLQYEK